MFGKKARARRQDRRAARRSARQERQSQRQANRNERVAMRQDTKAAAYKAGINPNAWVGDVANAATKGLGSVMNAKQSMFATEQYYGQETDKALPPMPGTAGVGSNSKNLDGIGPDEGGNKPELLPIALAGLGLMLVLKK